EDQGQHYTLVISLQASFADPLADDATDLLDLRADVRIARDRRILVEVADVMIEGTFDQKPLIKLGDMPTEPIQSCCDRLRGKSGMARRPRSPLRGKFAVRIGNLAYHGCVGNSGKRLRASLFRAS